MKTLVNAVVLAAVFAVPAVSFAQSNQPVTRAQVRAELVELERAGYNPADWIHYPDNIQAAQARVSGHAAAADTSGYGTQARPTSQSGGLKEIRVSSYSAPVYIRN